MFKPWEQMTTLEQYAVTYSDMYKDAYGFRPRGEFPSTEAEYEKEFDYLEKIIEREINEEKAEQAEALNAFDARMESLQATLGQDRATVLRWLLDADKVNTKCPQSVAHWYYDQGLAFDVIRKALQHDHGFSARVAGLHA